jgi:CRISPR/Cas system-associated endonuclease Cas1
MSYAGLDFYAGYLYADRPGKPSLVLDMMEEFRQQLVDRTLVGLITRGVIKSDILAAEAFEEGRVLSKDVKNLIKDLVENVQLYPVCDTCFKGRKEVGKPKRYELKEEKDKIAYF